MRGGKPAAASAESTTVKVVEVDDESPISDCHFMRKRRKNKKDCRVRISRHRSCWKHVVASLCARGKKIGKQEAQRLRNFERTSPCFWGTFPCRERSKRRIKHKNAITKVIKQKQKLDSEVFENYFENIWKSFSQDRRISFAYFDSLWFSLYLKASSKGKVLSWIKKKQVFSKKYVLVPIVRWSHWSLLIFCHLGESIQSKSRTPCMLLLDSLGMASPRRLEPDIRKFVCDIYKSEGRTEDEKLISQIPLLVPKVPQQRNGEECGNFVLYFMNLFVQNAPENFSIEEYPYFMNQNWFGPESVETFFQTLECC